MSSSTTINTPWRARHTAFFMSAIIACSAQAHPPAQQQTFHAEATHFAQTGTYAEVEFFCDTAAQQHPAQVRCLSIGTSAEGRPIRALVVSRSGALTPAQAQRAHLPVTLVIGGTHAGEIDGKDAGLMWVRDWLRQPPRPDPLAQQVLLFVPVFNVDGHEHPRPHNRPNQNGPALQGERVTAQRINLNRDWMLGQAIEMKAMLALVQQWDPLLTLDLHVTDGVRFRHDVSFSISPMFGTDADLQSASAQFESDLMARVEALNHHPLPYTPVLLDLEDPRAGIMRDVDAPHFSHVYPVLRNRLGLLVEDHAWDPYDHRVQTSYDVIDCALGLIAAQGQTLLRLTAQSDAHARQLAGQQVSLDWRNAYEAGIRFPSGTIDLLGYEYTTHSDAPVVGGRLISYDTSRPVTWQVPNHAEIMPDPEATVTLPGGGYLIPAGWTSVVRPYLDRHGVRYQILRQAQDVDAQEMEIGDDDVRFDLRTFQGRLRAYVQGHWTPARVRLLPGSLYVPIAQTHALLAAHLLEPNAPDSLSSWGLFNQAYEITDNIANHRELELAQWMYQQDPKILAIYGAVLYEQLPAMRAAYQARLEQDEQFRNDPESRRAFWIAALPYHDPTFGKYPVLRTDRPL